MRGSSYYQTSLLVKTIFRPKTKKAERIDLKHDYFQCIASYQTMETYRAIWNNLALFIKNEFGIHDMEKLIQQHIEAYLLAKLLENLSLAYFKKLVSAIGKLETALNRFSKTVSLKNITYDFSVREHIYRSAKSESLLYDGYHKRAYKNPQLLITKLTVSSHQLAATIQLESGTRFEGIGCIKKSQLKGLKEDPITRIIKGQILTKEKGGKEGIILISVVTYQMLETHLTSNTSFKIDYHAYAKDIRTTCVQMAMTSEGSHGFRWCFAKNRMHEYQQYGYSYDQALQGVSLEMKHYRRSITNHYLG